MDGRNEWMLGGDETCVLGRLETGEMDLACPSLGAEAPLKCYSPDQHGGTHMEPQELYRGRLIDHIQLVVKDFGASRRFYGKIFEALRLPFGGEGEGYFWVDELFISTADNENAAGELTGRIHLAFQAKDRAMVDAFYKAGLEAGGKDNGAPGERAYHPGYYAAFLLDPDGNNIEAVYHGPHTSNVDAVKVTF
jgi:catechol 2,3-dioxygenase-like lactoylglutathione lyase family enzyme